MKNKKPEHEWMEKQQFGGKGATLLELKYAKFPVPEFVIIPVNAMFSLDVKNWILNKFDGLVAVRSSSTIEDGKEASCAGQHDSFLNVTKEELLVKIQLVRDSINNERAIKYRQENNIPADGMAVIIQKMVKATKSGVAFSVHPVTENPNHMLIEVVEGLSDDFVSGKVKPESHIIYKSEINHFESNLFQSVELTELSKLILDIEKHYGYPVDVEWCYDGTKFWIVQCRPITTLKKEVNKNE